MIGKPEWFSPRKFGWGLGIRKWQGIIYIIVVGFVLGMLFASPLDSTLKIVAAVIITALVVADMLHIMYKVYSNLDEREERHQLVAERNASFTAIAVLLVYVLYLAIGAAVKETAPDLYSLIPPMVILLAMALAKGGTLMLLERD